ncbi:DeoR/GlpR family DNA-binding transcription regulator [Albidovulum sp.]
MPLSLRQSEILDIARVEGKVEVERLARRFGVTVQTIRRDLTELADAGMLDRVHGGAVLRAGVANIGYEERRRMNAAAKAAIGAACAAAIPDNSSLFLNIGTTTEAVARALTRHRNLTVVTNNLNVANILAANESCDVIVAGGVLRRADGGLVGDLTTEAIGHFKVDYAIIGTSALDLEGDLLDFDPQEVRVSRAILHKARKSCVVADRSKLERRAPVCIASLSQIDTLFTDAPLPAPLAARCRAWRTEVVIAAAPAAAARPLRRT